MVNAEVVRLIVGAVDAADIPVLDTKLANVVVVDSSLPFAAISSVAAVETAWQDGRTPDAADGVPANLVITGAARGAASVDSTAVVGGVAGVLDQVAKYAMFAAKQTDAVAGTPADAAAADAVVAA